MTTSSALALLLATVARVAPCPSGDAPRGTGEWTPGQARLSLRVDEQDLGHLRARLRWSNETDGPAHGDALLADGDSTLVVTGARVRHGAEAGAAALVEADDADVVYGAFLEALEVGVQKDEVRAAGRARVAVVVQRAEDGIVLHAAGACSARVVDVELDALLTSVPHAGGLRFFVPRVFADSRIDVDGDGDGAVWIDGRPGRRGVRADATPDARAGDPGDATFVVDVFRSARAGGGPRVHGGLVTLQPLAAPSTDTTRTAPRTTADTTADTAFSLIHAAVDLPRPLIDAPDELRVVFVVDASVSAGDAGVARALQLVDAVLDELPVDAGWALVTAARRPSLVVPPWRGVRERHWPAVPVDNGSNLADAVALARRIAADALPGRGRVLVLSDLQQPAGDQRLAATIHPPQSTTTGALPLVHVVALPADMDAGTGVDFTRAARDDDAFTDGRADIVAVEATGGVFVDADTSGGGDPRVLARYLVRPTRLDEPVLVVDGAVVDAGSVSARTWDDLGLVDDGSLQTWPAEALPAFVVEGGGLRASGRLAGAVRRAALRGRLWGTTVELPLSAMGAWSTAATASAVAALDESLDDDEVRAAARRRGFVSRVTSLLSLPAWRPASPGGMGIVRGSSCGCGCCGHICDVHGTSGVGVGHATPGQRLVEQDVLDRLAGEAAARCDSAVDVDVEAGDLEVLDVVARTGGACVVEFFWAVRLDHQATGDASFERHSVRTAHAPRPAKPEPASSTAP